MRHTERKIGSVNHGVMEREKKQSHQFFMMSCRSDFRFVPLNFKYSLLVISYFKSIIWQLSAKSTHGKCLKCQTIPLSLILFIWTSILIWILTAVIINISAIYTMAIFRWPLFKLNCNILYAFIIVLFLFV